MLGFAVGVFWFGFVLWIVDFSFLGSRVSALSIFGPCVWFVGKGDWADLLSLGVLGLRLGADISQGWRKTTKREDKTIMNAFKKLRPPGHGVDSRMVHSALPKKLKKKVARRTVIRRVEELGGYVPTKKINKSDPGPALAKRRVDFGREHVSKSEAQWKMYLQGVGDIKEFTFYPSELQPKFERLKSTWTYMKPGEKLLPAFVRPRRWFSTTDWKKTRKQKVFGLTASNGKSLAVLVPTPFDATKWAKIVREKVQPFLMLTFPTLSSYRILLDGEKILHAEPAKGVLKEKKINILHNWPPYSPDLNPQEHVWPGAEKNLRAASKKRDTFATFQQRCLKAVRDYKGGDKLVGSMAKRMRMVIDLKGAMIDK